MTPQAVAHAGDEQISALQQQVARLTVERDAVLEDAEHRGAELFKQRDALKRHLDAIAEALGLGKAYLPDQLAGMVRELLEERNAERQRAEKNGAESRELAWQLAAARAERDDAQSDRESLRAALSGARMERQERIDAKLQEVENRMLQARANAKALDAGIKEQG